MRDEFFHKAADIAGSLRNLSDSHRQECFDPAPDTTQRDAALSGQTAMKSGSLRTPKLTIRPRRHETAQVSVYAYDRPTVQFPLDGRKAAYNGIRVKVSRHEVEFRGLPPGTSAVEVRFARGVVRGKGGEAKARASLQGTRNARAKFSAAWR